MGLVADYFRAHKEARAKTARRNGTINESTAQKGSLEQEKI